MRKFLVLLFALMLVSSLPAYSYATQTYEIPDTVWGDSSIGWATTRDFNNYNDIKINTLNPHNGSRSVMLPLVDTLPFGQLHFYLLYCKTSFWSNGICTDSAFLHTNVTNGDEVEYYVYIPSGAPVDSIMAFVRDSDWRWALVNNYQASDLTFGAWNQLKAPVSDTNWEGLPIRLPLLQFDLWIYTDSMLTNPSCTLYMDDVSSQPAGVEDAVGGDKVTLGTSINSVKFSMSAAGRVVVSVYRIDGSKAYEAAGVAPAGPNEVAVDVPAGVYIVRVIADAGETKVGKLLKL